MAVQIQIGWLLQKPTDLDLHCLLWQGMSCSAREGLKKGNIYDFLFVFLHTKYLLKSPTIESKFVPFRVDLYWGEQNLDKIVSSENVYYSP